MDQMRTTAIILFSFFGFFIHAQDYVTPLIANPEIQSESIDEVMHKVGNNQKSIDSTVFFITDTLSLPFFDEFSKNNFQQYDPNPLQSGLTSELFFSLLDEDTDIQLPNSAIYTDTQTYRLEVDLINDTVITYYFDSTRFNYASLYEYPVNYENTFGYPPYYVIDTIDVVPNEPDTIWFSNPKFRQDSARVFTKIINDPSKLWLNHEAYHNYRFAKDPWSLGVVTFDGLNEFGKPYIFGPTNVTMTCDTLLSKPLDLSPLTLGDSIYMSFLYQTEGLGDVPEEGDSLFLDFLDPTTMEWNRVWAAGGAPVGDFNKVHFALLEDKYLAKGFQFRFMNFGSPAGALDHFHLDYVNLRPLSGYQDTLFKDFAFVYPVSSLLKDFIQVPWKHYKSNNEGKMSDSVEVSVRNGSELTENNQNGSLAVFYEGIPQGNVVLNGTILSGGDINYAPTSTYFSYHDFSDSYSFSPTVNDTSARFDWIANASAQFPSFPQNDSTEGTQVFENVYAYDDGTAEKAYGVFGIQAELAYKFKAYQPDSLIGIQMHFVPTVNDFSNNLFLLAVWEDDNGRPGEKIYEDEFFFPKQPVYTSSQNKFHTYLFQDTAKVPVGETFYVGWRQIDEDRLNIGLDVNHDHSEDIFWSIDGGNNWNNSNFLGALMMRPIISSNLDFTLGVEKIKPIEKPTYESNLFPNPAYDSFQIRVDTPQPSEVYIFDAQGRMIDQGRSDCVFNVNTWKKGFYFVKISFENTVIATHKLIVH